MPPETGFHDNKTHEIDEKWIKASIIGTIWAASEIVLGSFLHNLKIPFSSNVLTGIGIIVLISSSYKWKDSGLFWRAGLICALMKTMSPSAVIFGPMIAIFSQAALLELSVRVFGKNIFGFVSGAMLAMSWNLFQKIMNFIIFYGYNIVDVYADLLKFAQKQLGLHSDIVWLPIIILLIIYCVLGLLAALTGIKAGRKLLVQAAENKAIEAKNFNPSSGKQKQSFHYSVLWLFFNLCLIILALKLLTSSAWYVWGPSIAVIACIWILRYQRALRQLSKPRFWMSFVVITMLTAFVFNKMQSQSLLHGFSIGIQMNFRAIVIILGFSVLGTELYNPKIRDFFLRTSIKQLPLALELSFESLPLMVANFPDLKTLLKNPVSIIYQIISQIDYRLVAIKRNLGKKIFIITGPVGQGKTTQIKKLAEYLVSRNISVGGVLSLRVVENETTIGYDIMDIRTGKREQFLRRTDNPDFDKIGNYSILPGGLRAGIDALRNSLQSSDTFIVIDEVGKLELENKGWAGILDEIHESETFNIILTVRNSYTDQVIKKWNFQNYTVFGVSEKDEVMLHQAIDNRIQQGSKPC